MKWAQFKKAAPTLARRAEKLFKSTDVLLLGTIRKDASPRIIQGPRLAPRPALHRP
jgi:hypothetical protein